ncbi:MAG: class I SAM-dependent methyltransferase [Magnetococcus sp. WYHC-3]
MTSTVSPVTLASRQGWMGWWPPGGWRTVLDPENGRIRHFLAEQAAQLPEGCRVLDAGAGRCPYAGLFVRHVYESCDHPGGFYPGQAHSFLCPLDAIPRPDGHYDAVILTQVLEHVPDPGAVLGELGRVLAPGGRLLVTVPLNGPLHGEPWHYYHFTHHALAHLAHRQGLELLHMEQVGGAFWVLGKRLHDTLRRVMKSRDPLRSRKRGHSPLSDLLVTLALLPFWLLLLPITGYLLRPLAYWLDRLDRDKSFTCGFTAVFSKPRRDASPQRPWDML